MENKLMIVISDRVEEFCDTNLDNLVKLYAVIKQAMSDKKDFIEILHKQTMFLIPLKNILYIKTIKAEDK